MVSNPGNLPAVVKQPATPALVWANGRPIDFEALRRDEAGPRLMSTRSINSGHPSQGMKPQRLAQLMIAAEQGDMTAYLELAEEIEEKEWHYASVLGTRKRAVAQLDITVEDADDSPEAKGDGEFIRDWLKRDTLESELQDILDAVGKSFSVIEIIWAIDSKTWLPDQLKWRDPRWFKFDPVDGETLLLLTENGPQPLSAFKYIQHVHKAKSGIVIRGGLARPAAWAWMFKNFGLKEWMSFLEVFGMPLRVGKYPAGTTEPDIRLLMSAVAQIGSDAAAVFPDSMTLEFIDGKVRGSGGDAGALFKSLVEYMDQQLSKLVLGQVGTTDAIAGGHAVGKVHNEVRGDIERADAKLLAATLNRDLVRPMIMLNRGQRARYPRIKIGRPDPVDIAGMANALKILVPFGLKVSEPAVRSRLGLPDAQPGEALLMAPQTTPATGVPANSGGSGAKSLPHALLGPSFGRIGAIRRPGEGATAASQSDPAIAAPDQIDATADEALGDWLPIVRPIVAPIDAMLADATSLDDVKARLIDALGEMDTDAFAELLARGSFAARIEGMADAAGS